ncbi:MAG: hypothetical protein ACJAXX_001130 [Roseivirga sp.]
MKKSDYFKDRILVEILITATMNHGRRDTLILMEGQVGAFDSKYYKLAKEEIKEGKKEEGDLKTFMFLLERLGLGAAAQFNKCELPSLVELFFWSF